MKLPTYKDLLQDARWKRKRDEILERDGHECRRCGCKADLQVHHLQYLMGRKPWEYHNDALISLCGDCHSMAKNYGTPVVPVPAGTDDPELIRKGTWLQMSPAMRVDHMNRLRTFLAGFPCADRILADTETKHRQWEAA